MPLYIVRWPNLSATLIRADDEDHLQELLDEIGDPGAAIWEKYNGPVWIEFEPKRRESEPGKFVIATDLNARTGPGDILPPGEAMTDTCTEMYWTILKRLFPHLHVALQETAGSDLTDEQARQILTEALSREEWHGAAYHERAKSYADSDSIMGSAGLTVLPRNIEDAILAGLETAEEEGRDISEEISAIGVQRQSDLAWHEVKHERLQAERRRAREDAGLEPDDDEFDDDLDDEFDDD